LGKFLNNAPKAINANDGGTQIEEKEKKRNVSKKTWCNVAIMVCF
jgi:hypothetical protein